VLISTELVHLLNPESQEEVISKMLSDVIMALRGCSLRQSVERNEQLLTVPNVADKMNELTTLFSEMQTNKKKRRPKRK
jgi:2-phospho-L-lactate guanylyltransferase (CobY/MobA/RfbA family)